MTRLSRTKQIILIVFGFLLLLGVLMAFALGHGTVSQAKLTFAGFTNVLGSTCGLFEPDSPSYLPHRWILLGSLDIKPKASVRTGDDETTGQVFSLFFKTNGMNPRLVYAIRVPPGAATMQVEIEEQITHKFGYGIQIPFRHEIRLSTSEVFSIPDRLRRPQSTNTEPFRSIIQTTVKNR
jgi:hypothetical protein